MEFELTNTERLYFGLKKVEEHWEKVQLSSEIYLYFDGTTIKKAITITPNSYNEDEMNEETEHRQLLLPKTSKGKPKKLNFSSFQARNGIGTYFQYNSYGVRIGNYTTQKTFYSTYFEDVRPQTFEDLKQWIKAYIEESTEADLVAVQEFSRAPRERIKLQEGDFFCFKVDRRTYGFGRIVLDIRKLRKEKCFETNKHYGLTNLMGQALMVKIYHKMSSSKTIDLNVLKSCEAFPSQQIMDNHLFYGDYEIIGHQKLEPDELEFPISYSRSISHNDQKTVYLQWGLIYKETTVKKFNKYLTLENPFATPNNSYSQTFENPYRNEEIGMSINLNKKLLETCIQQNSNIPFWNERRGAELRDLRSPNNQAIRAEIFTYFGLDPQLSYSENLNLLSELV